MTKPFDTLYADLEKALKLGDRKHRGPERYLRGIELIRQKIGKVRTQDARYIQNGAREVEYFREVWPAFYGKLFLYIRLYGLELRRETSCRDAWSDVITAEEDEVDAFFQQNWEFWQDYRSGAAAITEQFTRAYSTGRILDPLALVLDPEGATLASFRAATCLATFSYAEWLAEERGLLGAGTVSAANLGYSFGRSDSDLAEWLSGLQAVEAIYYNGEPADLSRLQKWSRLAVGREVPNIYDRVRLLRNRKKERLAFTKKTGIALERRWNQAEGKYE